jgi:c-di-GMP phosphodiesterase
MKYSPTGRLITSEPLKGSVFQMGRQPIMDLRGEIFGYELLYRSSTENYINVMDGDVATLTVFLNTFSVAGLNSMVGSRKAFFNVTRNFLIGRYPIPVSPDRIILEIQQDFNFDSMLTRSLKELSAQGYQIALDGVTSRQQILPVTEIIHFVKINIPEMEPIVLPRMVRELKEKFIRPIAEKIETQEEYEMCRKAGFDLFQGFYFRRPEVIQGRNIHSSRAVIQKILTVLKNPNVRIEELESAFASDITIAYRLLKLVNSGYYHSSRVQIVSIRQAFLLIGLDRLKNWLNLLLEANSSNEMQSLSLRAMIRAKTAAALALDLQVPHPDTCFLAGLLSVLDTALELPLKDALEGLSLSNEIVAALTTGQGQLGPILQVMLWAEQENWDEIAKFNLDAEKVKRICLESATWAEQYC